jgi:hypothetical protein
MGALSPVKEPKDENMKIKSPVEANSGRVTDRARKARRNLRADEQELHRRPARWEELARHSEFHGFSRGGKYDGCAGKQRVLTWGDRNLTTQRALAYRSQPLLEVGELIAVVRSRELRLEALGVAEGVFVNFSRQYPGHEKRVHQTSDGFRIHLH